MNSIPEITSELGSGWRQPDRSQIEFSDGAAKMSREALEMLGDYSYSVPTALYPGKMWKSYHFGLKLWFLRWVERSADRQFVDEPGTLVCCSRVIATYDEDDDEDYLFTDDSKLPVWML